MLGLFFFLHITLRNARLEIEELSWTMDYLEQTRLYVEGEGLKAHCAYKGDPCCQHIQDFAILTHPQPLQLVQNV